MKKFIVVWLVSFTFATFSSTFLLAKEKEATQKVILKKQECEYLRDRVLTRLQSTSLQFEFGIGKNGENHHCSPITKTSGRLKTIAKRALFIVALPIKAVVGFTNVMSESCGSSDACPNIGPTWDSETTTEETEEASLVIRVRLDDRSGNTEGTPISFSDSSSCEYAKKLLINVNRAGGGVKYRPTCVGSQLNVEAR